MSHDDMYYPGNRFRRPQEGRQVENPYDLPSEILQDQIQRNIAPVFVMTLNLTTAGSQVIGAPGMALVLYGHDGSNTKTVNTTAFCNAFFDGMDAARDTGFPMKHARGFRGPFSKVVLSWPAQNGVYVDVVVHRYKGIPWIDGESAT